MADTPGRTYERYSDRFFGENAPAGDAQPTAREQWRDPALLRHGQGQHEPDLTEVGVEGPDARTSFERWRVPVAIGIAFALGASGGAYAWDGWRDHTAVLAAKGEIHLRTSVTTSDWAFDGFQVTVDFLNDGPYDVRVTDPTFVDLAMVTGDVDPFTVPAEGRITEVLPVTLNCTTEQSQNYLTSLEGEIRADVTTADGNQRMVTLPAGADDEAQLSFLGSGCQQYGDDPSSEYFFSTASVTVTGGGAGGLGGDGTTDGGGGLVVVSHLQLGDGLFFGGPAPINPAGPTSIEVTGMTMSSGSHAYALSTDPALPHEMAPADEIAVTWEIDDCAAAIQATQDDMTISFSARSGADETSQNTYSSDVPIELAIALVRLANERCG